MKKVWTNRWKKVLIWLSGYLSFIAFAIVGGYTIVKSEDEELKKTTKAAFFVTLLFTAVSALISILSDINALSGYKAGFTAFLSWFSFVITLAEIAVYAVFIVLAIFGGDNPDSSQETEKKIAPDQDTQTEEKQSEGKTAKRSDKAVETENADADRDA